MKNVILNINSKKWIFFGILIKSAFFCYFLYLGHTNYPTEYQNLIYVECPDTPSFLQPIENLLAHGNYIGDANDQWSQVTRMPGYGFIYLILRILFSPENSKIALVLLQLVSSGASVFFLSHIAFYMFKIRGVFIITFIAYSISPFVNFYDICLLSESFGTNSLIISIYFFFKYNETNKPINLFASGLLFTLTVLLKPVVLLLFFVFSSYLGYKFLKENNKIRLQPILNSIIIFSWSLLLFECFWIARNYYHFNKIIPLQYNAWLMETGEPLKDVKFHAYRWVASVGGDMIYYRSSTLGAWLHKNKFSDKGWMPPQSIYTSKYNYDSLLITREKFITYLNNPIHITNEDSGSKENIAQAIDLNRTFDKYYASHMKEKPFHYYISNRLSLLKSFLVHSGSSYLPYKNIEELKKEYFSLMLKALWSLIYWLVLILGLIGLLGLISKKTPESIFTLFTILYLILVFPFIVRVIDIRYLNLAFPFLTISASLAIYLLLKKAIRSKSLNL